MDQILGDEQVTSPTVAGTVLWPLCDNLGTVRDVAAYDSNTGITTVTNHLIYDSFGKLTSGTNPLLFAYTSRPYDPSTALQNNGVRWYELATHTWINEDPAAADENLYRYCGNNPVIYVDPSGLKWKIDRNGAPRAKATLREG